MAIDRPRHAPLPLPRRASNRGGALLAVLWLVAALSVIALTIAATVRAEIDRTTTNAEGVRAYYLAKGALDRAALYIQWGANANQPGHPPVYYQRGMRTLEFRFPTGLATVDVMPETAKLNVNRAAVEDLLRLFLALGLAPPEAVELAAAVDDWRKPASEAITPFDRYYLSLTPSFPARHASLENVEELLLVKGMTPELFYGAYVPGSGDSLVWRSGVRDCLTVYGRSDSVDINWAEPPVLAAVGLPPQAVALIDARRRQQPFLMEPEMAQLGIGGFEGAQRLQIGGRSIFTLRATAQLLAQDGSLSATRRSIAAVVDLNERTVRRPFTTLRWYDRAWKQ
ncbi:MAG: general secretion pathway protein GspK [Bryobacterales bacterium]|nr:general secretion pathway protein GspK [Bryobacterales bacterium]